MRYTLDKSNPIEHEGKTFYVVLDSGMATHAIAVEGVEFANDCEVTGGHFYGGVFNGGDFYGGHFNGGHFYDGWLPLQIQGSRHFVNIPDGENIQIGCKCGSVDWWLENYEQIGKSEGYTQEQIKEYKRYIDLAAEMIKEAE
jgi:hypothetical protein